MEGSYRQGQLGQEGRMSDRQMQTGMDWVETRLSGLAEGQTASINTRGWEIDSTDLTASRRQLVVSLNGQRQVVTFDDADLEARISDLVVVPYR